jgi:hypothetical protein
VDVHVWMWVIQVFEFNREQNCTKTIHTKVSVLSKATRLGEFSPIELMFSLSSVLKIMQVAQIFWLLFPHFKFGFGLHFEPFFRKIRDRCYDF